MVCIYCGKPTQVSNSRSQKQLNQVWRRRQCSQCKAIFTTHETVVLDSAVTVRRSNPILQPFSRDKLFMSIYKSCKHRSTALEDAAGLTQTILITLRDTLQEGAIDPVTISNAAHQVLARFDKTAATVYRAYHPAQELDR